MADDRTTELAAILSEVSRVLLAQPDVHTTLERIVGLAVATIEHCEHAGTTMVVRGQLSSPASSDAVPAVVDTIQSETGEGPCIDAIVEHRVFQTGHLSTEARWPRFARRASTETGVESVLSFRLFVDEDTMGALNLYSSALDAFDDYDAALGAVFATHASLAWSSSRTMENLRHGMASREVIGEAVGILMAREGAGERAAFEMLVRASQRLNTKLREVAAQVVRDNTPPGA